MVYSEKRNYRKKENGRPLFLQGEVSNTLVMVSAVLTA